MNKFVYDKYCSKLFNELIIEHFTNHVNFFDFHYIYGKACFLPMG